MTVKKWENNEYEKLKNNEYGILKYYIGQTVYDSENGLSTIMEIDYKEKLIFTNRDIIRFDIAAKYLKEVRRIKAVVK